MTDFNPLQLLFMSTLQLCHFCPVKASVSSSLSTFFLILEVFDCILARCMIKCSRFVLYFSFSDLESTCGLTHLLWSFCCKFCHFIPFYPLVPGIELGTLLLPGRLNFVILELCFITLKRLSFVWLYLCELCMRLWPSRRISVCS